MVLLLASAGLGFELDVLQRVPLDAPAHRLVAANAEDHTRFFAIGADSIVEVFTEDGSQLVRLDRGANDLLVEDAAADGDEEMWLCDTNGLWWIDWGDPEAPGPPVRVRPEPCEDISSVAGWLLVAGDGVYAYPNPGDGTLGSPLEIPLGQVGETLLVDDGVTALIGSVGASEFGSFVDGSVLQRTIDGLLTGVAVAGDRQAWSVGPEAQVELSDGFAAAVGADASALRFADLDGDGIDELLVLHPDGIGVLPNGAGPEVITSSPGIDLLVMPDTPCDRLWSLGADGVSLSAWISEACADLRWPPYTPGWLASEIAVIEGAEFEIDAPSTVRVDWDVPDGANLQCTSPGLGLSCEAGDDEKVTITATVWDGDELLDVVATTVVVVNMPPSLDVSRSDTLSYATVSMGAGDLFSALIPLYDPGGDAVRVHLLAGPDDLLLDGERVLWAPTGADVGFHRVDFMLTDDDGAQSEIHYFFGVYASEGPGCGFCCGGASGGAALLLLGWGRLRRRR